MHRVFVYGTLKRGFPYHEVGMKGHRFIGRCRTCDAFPLVVAGKWLSPILIAEPGVGHRVFDDLEGTHLPIGYHRLMISVENVDGGAVLDAWTYVKDRSRIDVIHSDPLEEYHLDPRYVPASEREA
jgi:gamma-glutamylaminecyclotransferase